MGVRYHRSKEILPGIRLNFSKSGVGVSFGKKGFRYSIGPRGDRMTVGIPGTGLSYTTTSSSKRKRTDSSIEEHPVYIPQSESLKDPKVMVKKLSGVDPEEIIAKLNLQLWIGIATGIFVDLLIIFDSFFK